MQLVSYYIYFSVHVFNNFVISAYAQSRKFNNFMVGLLGHVSLLATCVQVCFRIIIVNLTKNRGFNAYSLPSPLLISLSLSHIETLKRVSSFIVTATIPFHKYESSHFHKH